MISTFLSLQEGVRALMDDQRIAEFLNSGVLRIPGVEGAAFCRRGVVLAETGSGWKAPKVCEDCFAKRNGERGCPQPCPCSEAGLLRFGLNGTCQCYGGLLVKLSDPDAFGPYQALLDSTVKLAALLMENREQSDALQASSDHLEKEVAARTQALLAKSEECERYFEGSLDLLSVADTEGFFRKLNPQWEKVLGYSTKELIDRPYLDFVHPEDREMTRAAMAILIARGELSGFVNRYLARDGAAHWLEWNGRLLDGRIHATARDISERKHVEADLRRLETAVRQAAESIVITDVRGRIQYVNPAFEETSGYTLAEVLGKTPRVVKSQQHPPEFYERLWQTIRRGHVWSGRFINRRKDGTLYHEDATISPVRDERGEISHFVAVKRDATREVELEEQFQQAQKMEAVGRLAGGVAHDFNNLLTAIKGNLALALMDVPEAHELRDFLNEADRAADRAAALTRQLLAFSRKQVLEPKILDLNELIIGFRKMLARLIGEEIELGTSLQDGLGRIKADAGQIEQVILNLAVNSRDAMPDGGMLRISSSKRVVDESFCERHPGTTPGEYVVLEVADDGCGMTEEVRRHIFEPFFTTKEKGKGTGLGLATVYGVVMQNRGAISVESEVGHGTKFTLYFPVTSEAPEAKVASAASPGRDHGSETILFVEDEESLRSLMQKFLSRSGYRVRACANAAEALAVAAKMTEPIDLLVTDVIMPGMNGRQLAIELGVTHPGLKVLFTSGYTADVLGKHGVLDDGINFIAKPYASETLMRQIRSLMAGDKPGD